MIYSETETGKLYADIALRLGKILKQYDEFPIPSDEKYEVTLRLVILQNLTTQYQEHHEKIDDKFGNKYKTSDDLAIFESYKTTGEYISLQTFHFKKEENPQLADKEPSLIDCFYHHLRNSTSHPLAGNPKHPNQNKAQTGYYINSENGQIKSFIFYHAPEKSYKRRHDNKKYKYTPCTVELSTEQLNQVIDKLIDYLSLPLKAKPTP